ncbi:unnamed protein product [Ectocarpus sp. CCAP 1310/34]|nr:unnamed protein product [Ectocarpus sp. CCAP 1310/34]
MMAKHPELEMMRDELEDVRQEIGSVIAQIDTVRADLNGEDSSCGIESMCCCCKRRDLRRLEDRLWLRLHQLQEKENELHRQRTAILSRPLLPGECRCVMPDRHRHLRRRPAITITIATATAASPGITRGSRFSTLAAAAATALSPASGPTLGGVYLNGRKSCGVDPAGQCFRSEGGSCSADGSGVKPAATRSGHTADKSSKKTL